MTEHIAPPQCDVHGCRSEAWKWFEDPAYPNRTKHVCEDHIDGFRIAEDADEVRNSAGHVVEVGEYACADDCQVCWA